MSNTVESLGLEVPASVSKQTIAQAILDATVDATRNVQAAVQGIASRLEATTTLAITVDAVDRTISELTKIRGDLVKAVAEQSAAREQFQKTRTVTT